MGVSFPQRAHHLIRIQLDHLVCLEWSDFLMTRGSSQILLRQAICQTLSGAGEYNALLIMNVTLVTFASLFIF